MKQTLAKEIQDSVIKDELGNVPMLFQFYCLLCYFLLHVAQDKYIFIDVSLIMNDPLW